MPMKRSGVMSANTVPIQLRKPNCGLNNRELTPAVTTPMMTNARMKRTLRRGDMGVRLFAWGIRRPSDGDQSRAVDRRHGCSRKQGDDQALGVALDHQRIEAAAFGKRIRQSDAQRHVADM